MYTIKLHAGGGQFKSALTGNVYHFKNTPDHSEKRRAHDTMLADDAVVRKAAHERIGRAVSDIELLRYKTPDTRTLRERAETDTVHRSNAPTDTDHNHYADRANQLRDQLARESRASRREAIEARLKLAEGEAERFERRLEAKRDWEAKVNHPDVRTASVLADSWRVLLRSSRDPEMQPLLERVEAAIAHLGDTADHATCRAALDAIAKEYDASKLAKAATLENQAREIRQAAREIKAEANPELPEPEQIVE
jgi:hypothetical protein